MGKGMRAGKKPSAGGGKHAKAASADAGYAA